MLEERIELVAAEIFVFEAGDFSKMQHGVSEVKDLGCHAVERYNRVCGAVDAMPEEKVDFALLELLLTAENVRNEMKVYEENGSLVLQLAHTGYYVRRIELLFIVLDEICERYKFGDPLGRSDWRFETKQERLQRVKRYDSMLLAASSSARGDVCEIAEQDYFFGVLEREDQQEESLTLLKTALENCSDGSLMPEEVAIIKRAFASIAEQSGVIVVSNPSWLMMPFEFAGDLEISRRWNYTRCPDHVDVDQFIHKTNVWSSLHHPHITKLLGACHVGSRRFFVQERGQSLEEYIEHATSRKQVWGRISEIAMAMQFLHENGLMCDEHLTMDHVFCSEAEGKALLSGAHLVLAENDPLRISDGQSRDDSMIRSRCNETADIIRLCLLAVNCLHAFSTSRDRKEQRTLMPTSRPDFVDKKEWQMMTDMLSAGTASRTPMLYAVDCLKGLDCTSEASGDLNTNEISKLMTVPAPGECLMTLSDCSKVQFASQAREESLLKLLKMMKSSNTRSASLAREHLLNVEMKHSKRYSRKVIEGVVDVLTSGNDDDKEWAALAIKDLASGSSVNRIAIASCGGIRPLIALVRDGNDKQKENAAVALRNLALNDEIEDEIVVYGAIASIVAVTSKGNNEQKSHAANALWNLTERDEHKHEIASCGGIAALVSLLRDGNDEQKVNAASALGKFAENGEYDTEIASCGGIEPLVVLTKDGTDLQKALAAMVLAELAGNLDNTVKIAACGGISPLVELVRCGNEDQKQYAAAALCNLGINDANSEEITACGAIAPLVDLLRGGNAIQKEYAAFALFNLAASEDNETEIAAHGAIAPLIALVRVGNDKQKQIAAGALWNLSANNENKVEIASSGGIGPLVALIRDGNDIQKEYASAAIWNLSTIDANKVEIVSLGGIRALVALLHSGNDEHKENAAGIMWNLACGDPGRATAIRECGVVTPLLLLVESGNEEQKIFASGVLAFFGPDAATKKLVAMHGGIQSLLKYAEETSDDGDLEEGLIALHKLCCDDGSDSIDGVVHENFVAGSGTEILSQLLENSSERIQQLARDILSRMGVAENRRQVSFLRALKGNTSVVDESLRHTKLMNV